jgi:hypothetical protein
LTSNALTNVVIFCIRPKVIKSLGDKIEIDVLSLFQNVINFGIRPKSWRKRQDSNLHKLFKLDCLADSYGYRFHHVSTKLERAIGFEPMINGFANRRL